MQFLLILSALAESVAIELPETTHGEPRDRVVSTAAGSRKGCHILILVNRTVPSTALLALMRDLERISVGVAYIGDIVFQS
jgi:hypothetical protein